MGTRQYGCSGDLTSSFLWALGAQVVVGVMGSFHAVRVTVYSRVTTERIYIRNSNWDILEVNPRGTRAKITDNPGSSQYRPPTQRGKLRAPVLWWVAPAAAAWSNYRGRARLLLRYLLCTYITSQHRVYMLSQISRS